MVPVLRKLTAEVLRAGTTDIHLVCTMLQEEMRVGPGVEERWF